MLEGRAMTIYLVIVFTKRIQGDNKPSSINVLILMIVKYMSSTKNIYHGFLETEYIQLCYFLKYPIYR